MPERDDRVYLAEVLDAIALALQFIKGLDSQAFSGGAKTVSAVVR